MESLDIGDIVVKFYFGIICPINENWRADWYLWNYVPIQTKGFKMEHGTYICESLEKAIELLNEVSEKYLNDRIESRIRIVYDC